MPGGKTFIYLSIASLPPSTNTKLERCSQWIRWTLPLECIQNPITSFHPWGHWWTQATVLYLPKQLPQFPNRASRFLLWWQKSHQRWSSETWARSFRNLPGASNLIHNETQRPSCVVLPSPRLPIAHPSPPTAFSPNTAPASLQGAVLHPQTHLCLLPHPTQVSGQVTRAQIILLIPISSPGFMSPHSVYLHLCGLFTKTFLCVFIFGLPFWWTGDKWFW